MLSKGGGTVGGGGGGVVRVRGAIAYPSQTVAMEGLSSTSSNTS